MSTMFQARQRLFLFMLPLALMSACSTTQTRSGDQNVAAIHASLPGTTEDYLWNTCYFRMTWSPGQYPNWPVDLFLAHAVIGPVLPVYAGRLPRWRFHRRAVHDAAGHQFSFLFYTDGATAERIKQQIENTAVLKRALDENYIHAASCENPDTRVQPDLEDTSDPNWSETMQRNWPSYIMGISSLWLGLIDDAVKPVRLEDNTMEDIIAAYGEANLAITRVWQSEAQHALLHHLNAIFGYEPMIINKAISF